MANKRRPAAQRNRKAPQEGAVRNSGHDPHLRQRALQEALAVALGCGAVLTLLSLLSYHPADASLNASGSAEVQNWIGPAGAYWADMLLQMLGVGGYALGLGCLLASWRAIAGRRIRPGLREAGGTVLLVACIGSFAHLALAGQNRPYPAGGILGAILAGVLLEEFARVGAYVLSGAMVLLSLAITADGILAGLGLRGVGIFWVVCVRAHALWVMLRERRRRRGERRSELELPLPEAAAEWTIGSLPVPEERRQAKEQILRIAQEKGRQLGEAEAEQDLLQARARAWHDVSEPELRLDRVVDLAAEEAFELGELPILHDFLTSAEPVLSPTDFVGPELEEPPAEVSIRAAEPEPLTGAASAMEAEEEHEPVVSEPVQDTKAAPPQPTVPKRVVKSRKDRALEPEIVDVRPEQLDAATMERMAAERLENEASHAFELPPASLLDFQAAIRMPLDPQLLRDNAQKLTKTLKEYGIDGHVREIRPGPVVTMYEYVPAPGIKISKIAGLADDLAMSMEALRVRIVAPIPGKGAVGIEIPNENRETVYLKELIAHDTFRKAKSKVTLALGKDIEGNATVVDLAKMPHLLVAGATGSGKSVSINAMIMSIVCKSTPEEVRMIMVDPKMLELSVYDGIPHLLLPVVTDPKKASLALRWAVGEMERRYYLLSEIGARSIEGFNQKVRAAQEQGQPIVVKGKGENEPDVVCQPIPYIVVVVDELADLMMVASREVEASIMRLAQMARAAGIHLILATQRPSVDVITGVIKANFPTRVAFQVASKHDSRTIIDCNGAEHLLGRGDMLYLSSGAGGLMRVHGPFVSDEEIERTVAFLKQQGTPHYDESILEVREESTDAAGAADEDQDEMYDQAVAIVSETRQASISMIQRRLRIGYNRAARLVERMESEGVVGPADGAKPREVLVSPAAL